MYTVAMREVWLILVCNHPVLKIGHDGGSYDDMDRKIMVSF